MGRIPEWLEPYLKANSYNPIKEDIVNLESQSRQEMILKFASLTGASELSNYYTKKEIDNRISTIPKFSIEVVSQLPTRDISEATVFILYRHRVKKMMFTKSIYIQIMIGNY